MASLLDDPLQFGLLSAGLGILAHNRGNYGRAGPAIGRGALLGLDAAMGAHRANIDKQRYEDERDWERNRLTRAEARAIEKETMESMRRDEAQQAMKDLWGQFFQQQNVQQPTMPAMLPEPQASPQEPPPEPVVEPYVDAMPYQEQDMPEQPALIAEPMDAPLPPLLRQPQATAQPQTFAYQEAGAPAQPAAPPIPREPPRAEPSIEDKQAVFFQKLLHAASLNPDNPAIQTLLRAEIERQMPKPRKLTVEKLPAGEMTRAVLMDQEGNIVRELGMGRAAPMVSINEKAAGEGMRQDQKWLYEKYLPQLHEEERAARDNINRLQIISALPKHGILANFKKYGSSIAEMFGGSGEWASDVRLFQQTVGPMALTSLRVLGGNDSDKDRQFALDTMSKETDTETAIRRYVATKTVEERRKIGLARHIRKYLKDNPDADITDAEDDFRAKQKPMLEEPEMRQLFGGIPPDDLPEGATFMQFTKDGKRVYNIPGKGPQVEN